MDAKTAIRMNIDMASMICDMYLDDLNDDELMHRPHPECNHIKWQLGHLISSEHTMINGLIPGTMPSLPEGFVDRYTKETATSDEPANFDSKKVLIDCYKMQREGTMAALIAIPDEALDEPGPENMRSYAPTKGAVFAMQASHWLMHVGQWVPIRRASGKPIVI